MSYITKKAIAEFYDQLILQDILERNVKNLSISGNIMTIHELSTNKAFLTTIKKDYYNETQI